MVTRVHDVRHRRHGGDPHRCRSAASTTERPSGSATRAAAWRRRLGFRVEAASRRPGSGSGDEAAEDEVGVGHRRLECRRCRIADRPRLRAGALWPDAQAHCRTASTRAMLPPPVPTSWMSISGICIGRPLRVAANHRCCEAIITAPSSIDAGLGRGAAHVEGDRVARCRCRAQTSRAPITPAAGPDSSMRMHSRLARCATS